MDNTALTHVVVERFPLGLSSFAMAVADVFDTDTLTVSCQDAAYDNDFGPMRVFAPGTWIAATCYDHRGNPLRSFTPSVSPMVTK